MPSVLNNRIIGMIPMVYDLYPNDVHLDGVINNCLVMKMLFSRVLLLLVMVVMKKKDSPTNYYHSRQNNCCCLDDMSHHHV